MSCSLQLQELEARHDGIPILLVSHGDTLSILQATMEDMDVRQHRRYGTGDLVWRLVWTGHSGVVLPSGYVASVMAAGHEK